MVGVAGRPAGAPRGLGLRQQHSTGQRPGLPQGYPGKCPQAASQGGFYLHFVQVIES